MCVTLCVSGWLAQAGCNSWDVLWSGMNALNVDEVVGIPANSSQFKSWLEAWSAAAAAGVSAM